MDEGDNTHSHAQQENIHEHTNTNTHTQSDNILQWNANNKLNRAGLADLQHYMAESATAIALLQEHNFESGLKAPRHSTVTWKGRAAIIVHDSLTMTPLTHLNIDNEHVSACAADVRKPNSDVGLTVISVYRKHTQTGQTQFSEWLDTTLIKLAHTPYILGGDFNCHHLDWGSHKTDPIGRQVISVIETHDCTLLNTGEVTWTDDPGRDTPRQQSVIDLTIASTSLPQARECWRVEDSISDHRYIHTCLGAYFTQTAQQATPTQSHHRYVINREFKTNYEWHAHYARTVSDRLSSQPLAATITEEAHQLADALREVALDQEVIKRAKRRDPTITEWAPTVWTPHLQQLKKARRSALKNLTKAKKRKEGEEEIEACRLAYIEAAEALRADICRAQANAWQQFVNNELTSDTDTRTVWRKIHAIARGNVDKIPALPRGTPIMHEGTPITNTGDRATHIAQHYANVSAPRPPPTQPTRQSRKLTRGVQNLMHKIARTTPVDAHTSPIQTHESPRRAVKLDDDFQMWEMSLALKHISQDKAPGVDHVSNNLLKHAGETLHERLLALYNSSYTNGFVPQEWKHAIIIPVPKTKTPEVAKDYRPISLLVCIVKLLEKMIANRLSNDLEMKGLLESFQAGFRAKQSTMDQVVRLTQFAHECWARDKHALFFTFDVKKAFDTVWTGGLLYKLAKLLQLPPTSKLLRWLSHYLVDRTGQVCVGESLSETVTFHSGVPQGGSLSPLLFLVFVNDIVVNIPHADEIESPGFADDQALATGVELVEISPNLPLTVRVIDKVKTQECLNHLGNWYAANRLELAPEKTTLRLLSKPGTHTQSQQVTLPTFTLMGTQIKRDAATNMSEEETEAYRDLSEKDKIESDKTRSTRYLGIQIDDNLSYANHITAMIRIATQKMHVLKKIASYRWAACIDTLTQLYKQWIRSSLEYGNILTQHAPPTYQKKLHHMQADCAKIILVGTENKPSTNHTYVEQEMGITPLNLRSYTHTAQYALKLTHRTHESGLSRKWKRFYRNHKKKARSPPQSRSGSTMGKGSKPSIFEHMYNALHNLLPNHRNMTIEKQVIAREWVGGSPHEDDMLPLCKAPSIGAAGQRNPAQTRTATQFTSAVIARASATARQRSKQPIFVFTDGSRLGESSKGVGCAAVWYDHQNLQHEIGFTQETLPQDYDNVGAEIVAIRIGLQGVLKQHPTTTHNNNNNTNDTLADKMMHVFVDCDHAAHSARRSDQHHSVRSYRTEIEKIDKHKLKIRDRGADIMIHWIPGHANNTGNDRADVLAKEAAKRAPNRSTGLGQLATPLKTALKLLKSKASRLRLTWWEKMMALESTTSFTRSIREDSRSPTPALIYRGRPRQVQVCLARLRLGVATQRYNLHKMYQKEGKSFSPTCDACVDPPARDSAKHRIMQCPGYAVRRDKLLSDIQESLGGTQQTRADLQYTQILEPRRHHSEVMDHLADFLWDTGLIHLFVWNEKAYVEPTTRMPEEGNATPASTIITHM